MISLRVDPSTTYTYRGDRLTADTWRGQTCSPVRRPDGKCVRGRNGNMLVEFAGGQRVVVLGRQLRKQPPLPAPGEDRRQDGQRTLPGIGAQETP